MPTHEQLLIFRRRRRGALLIEICALILAPVIGMALFVLLGEEGVMPRVAALASFLLVFFSGQAVRHLYYRCPVCGNALPRGPRHVKLSEFFKLDCGNCGTTFD